jgi:pullulanase/glycogen debranching enzyme
MQPIYQYSHSKHRPTKDQYRPNTSDSHLIYSKCASSIIVYSSISNSSVSKRLNTVINKSGTPLYLLDLDDLNPEGSTNGTYSIVVLNNEAPRHLRSKAVAPPQCRELDQEDHTVCRFVDHRVPIEPLRQETGSDTPRILYEMHIKTFSPDGTFDGALSKLPYLVALGVTSVEIMPVNEQQSSTEVSKCLSITKCFTFTLYQSMIRLCIVLLGLGIQSNSPLGNQRSSRRLRCFAPLREWRT